MSLAVGEGGPLEESYCQRIVDGRLPELIHNAAEFKEALALPETLAVPIGAFAGQLMGWRGPFWALAVLAVAAVAVR